MCCAARQPKTDMLTLSAEQHPRLISQLGWAAFVVALVLVAVAAANLVLNLLPAPTSGGGVADQTGALKTASAVPDVDVARLHLFGQAGAQGQVVVEDAPETQLSLTLLGTVAAERITEGLAIIADDTGVQGFYGGGDELPGGAVLREIYADRVVLERAGIRESLRLERNEAAVSTNNRGRPLPGAAPVAQTGRLNTGVTPNVDWQTVRSNQVLDPVRLRQLGQQIRAQPFMENGQPVGVRLMATQNSTILSRLGLRSSDIVVAVNDIPLNDPSRQFELMSLLNNQSTFNVRVRRNGREMTLNIDASKITP